MTAEHMEPSLSWLVAIVLGFMPTKRYAQMGCIFTNHLLSYNPLVFLLFSHLVLHVEGHHHSSMSISYVV